MRALFIDTGYGLLETYKIVQLRALADECFFLMCSDSPIGNRTIDVVEMIESIKAQINTIKPDHIFICCNTLSPYFNGPSYHKILNYNLELLNDNSLMFVTKALALSLKRDNIIPLDKLADEIERNNIEGIIDIIRDIDVCKKNVILGCTHFPLVKSLFKFYHPHVNFTSSLERMLEVLSPSENHIAYANERAYQVFLKFMPSSVLKRF